MEKIKYELIETNVPPPEAENYKIPKFLKFCAFCALAFLLFIYMSDRSYPVEIYLATVDMKDYFVYNSGCQMSALDPFSKDVLRIYKKIPYNNCSSSEALVNVIYDDINRIYTLHMNKPNIKCCYKQIRRYKPGKFADNKFEMLPCIDFVQNFVVPQKLNAFITDCRREDNNKSLQWDAFTLVQPIEGANNESDSNNVDENENIERRPNVLLWGIDSLSRMNFQRTMPFMYKYLREENWFELRGYNKMGDNTFPNLMAVLTGYNSTRAYSVCQPKKVGGLDKCPIMWKSYKKNGYITAYAEDWAGYATFNYLKLGFAQPPTDYYPRPFMLAIGNTVKHASHSKLPCMGRRNNAEHLFDYAVQFTKIHKNKSNFGMFWANSFSHNNFALPSSMDGKTVEYMRTLKTNGIFDNSIIFFFSDHGMRFGPLRKLSSGFLEERMPIMYIWLPKWFRQQYPEFVRGLQMNRNRLTSPYDIYATLKHILELDTPQSELPTSEGCPSCYSIFYEVSESRDCSDAGIDSHWCSCQAFESNSITDKHVVDVVQQLINATNNYLAKIKLTKYCQKLKLSQIESVHFKNATKTELLESYLVRYKVNPLNATFEATAYWNSTSQKISINIPDISRLDAYVQLSQCISNALAKKFCICFH